MHLDMLLYDQETTLKQLHFTLFSLSHVIPSERRGSPQGFPNEYSEVRLCSWIGAASNLVIHYNTYIQLHSKWEKGMQRMVEIQKDMVRGLLICISPYFPFVLIV